MLNITQSRRYDTVQFSAPVNYWISDLWATEHGGARELEFITKVPASTLMSPEIQNLQKKRE